MGTRWLGRREQVVLAMTLLFLALVGWKARPAESAFSALTGNASTFASATSFGPTCTQPAKSFTFVTGFEGGVPLGTGLWDASSNSGGAPTSDTATVHGGSRSLRFAKNSAGDAFIARTPEGGAAASTIVARFALRFETLPAADVKSLWTFQVAAGENLDVAYVKSGSKLAMNFSGNVASSTVIAAGTWYVVDLRFNAGTNPRTATWRINGVNQTTASQSETGSYVNQIRLGSDTSSDVFTYYMDDLVFSETAADYPIGDGQILALRPNAEGTHVNAAHFQNNDNSALGSGSPGRLDDEPMTSTTDFVKQVTGNAASYAELAFPDVNVCVDGVMATLAYHASSTTANTARADIKVGGVTTNVLTDLSNTALTVAAKKVAPSGSAWTYTDLSNAVARLGYASDVSSKIPYWDALMLEYNVPA